MSSYLIDDKGRVWERASRQLHLALGVTTIGEELGGFLIRNLGYVGVGVSAGGSIVELRPSVASPLAFGALLYWLSDQSKERVMIASFEEGHRYEVFATRSAATQALIERVTATQTQSASTYLSRARALPSLPANDPMRALIEVCSGSIDRNRLSAVLSNGFKDRYLAVQYRQDSGSLLIEGVGTGYKGFAKRFLTSAIGQRLEDQPDYTYGKWVASAYRQALATSRPVLDEVDAVIAWPDKGARRHRYRRLVLPFQRKSESAWLLSASLEDSGIDLRPQVA